ncbi:MAG: group II truncated hemoglobin [Myxococcaceae bacterium]
MPTVPLKVPLDGWTPAAGDMPFDRLGGREAVFALVHAFYDAMESNEPALARLHALDENGRIPAVSRERFGLFLVGWLGGPQDYTEQHGHPRLRMRHAHVGIGVAERDAWLRCMSAAMDTRGVSGGVRQFLDIRFAEVADFLRNTP